MKQHFKSRSWQAPPNKKIDVHCTIRNHRWWLNTGIFVENFHKPKPWGKLIPNLTFIILTKPSQKTKISHPSPHLWRWSFRFFPQGEIYIYIYIWVSWRVATKGCFKPSPTVSNIRSYETHRDQVLRFWHPGLTPEAANRVMGPL